MVTDGRARRSDRLADGPTGRHRDRAQLLLAGAVVLAVALLGVAVLLNAAMSPGVATAGDRSESSLSSARQYERLVRADVSRLVAETDDEAALEANVTTYADRLGLVAARSDAAVLHVRLVDASPTSYVFEYTYVTPTLDYRTTISIARGPP